MSNRSNSHLTITKRGGAALALAGLLALSASCFIAVTTQHDAVWSETPTPTPTHNAAPTQQAPVVSETIPAPVQSATEQSKPWDVDTITAEPLVIKIDDIQLPTLPTLPEPQEDDPGFDCRIHGNHVCGVQIEGVWYLVNFDTMTVVPRG